MKKVRPVKETEEVKIEEIEEIITPNQSEVTMSPEAIESRYQAHLEKIRGGK